MAKTRSSTDIVKTLVSQGFKKRGRNWTAGAVRHLLKRQGQGKCKGTTFGIKKTSFKNRR